MDRFRNISCVKYRDAQVKLKQRVTEKKKTTFHTSLAQISYDPISNSVTKICFFLIRQQKRERQRVRIPLKPRKVFLGLVCNCLNCDSLRWSHFYFICIPAVHIISFCVSFLSRVDELNKLAGSQSVGLHSSASRALQREHKGHGSNRVGAPKNFFSGYFAIA